MGSFLNLRSHILKSTANVLKPIVCTFALLLDQNWKKKFFWNKIGIMWIIKHCEIEMFSDFLLNRKLKHLWGDKEKLKHINVHDFEIAA